LVAPAGIVTLAGTVTTEALPLDNETRAPPLGAGPLSVSVPKDGDPPTTLLGLKLSDVRVGPAAGCGVTAREAVSVSPEVEAEMVAVVELVVAMVATWNAAVVLPAGMVTLAGTVATEVLLLDSESATPPLGAGLFKVICPVEGFPPLTLVGLSESEKEVVGPGGGGV
jgi:hypothetical protein